jgi:HAD superfamily hydrolase (TIGR01549 family)
MIKLVIFDLDGTLVDAYTAIQKSLNFTLKKLGYHQVSLTTAKRAVGWGEVIFMKTFVKKEDIKEALKIYRSHHQLTLLRYSRVIPRAREILSLLKKRNYKLAIASNRPIKFTHILLKHLSLRKYFNLIVCAKGKSDIKPSPNLLLRVIKKLKVSPHSALYVGDMVIDVLAGKNAGIKTIAVLGGSSSRLQLRRIKPFRIITKLSDLLFFLPSFC